MKRLLGILLLALATLSLLLCLTTTFLWIRSHFVNDWFDYQYTQPHLRRWTGLTVSSNSGSLYVSMSRFQFQQDGDAEKYAHQHPDPEGFSWRRNKPSGSSLLRGPFWRRLGFHYVLEFDRPDGNGNTYSFPRAFVPHWFVIGLTMILPAILLVRSIRTRRRNRSGLCLTCGYDLRSSPALCPECGTAVPAALR
jgi:hypothetical protein